MFESLLATIGNTPLLEAKRIMASERLEARLLLKLESRNPLGSAKDRAALYMLRDAFERGALEKDGTVIEPTSGNTGVGLAYQCGLLGVRLILTMPESMSEERKRLLSALGAQLELTPAADGMGGAVARAEALQRETPGALILGQFTNPANARAHYETTGPELWRDSGGRLDAFIAAVGTGGTFTGTMRYLREQNPAIAGIAVEPAESPLLSGGQAGPHRIQGIGANFIPAILDRALISRVLPISGDAAYEGTRMLLREEGIFAGISSGAALMAGIALAREPQYRGKSIAIVLPDSGERYLSTGVFGE